MRKDDNYGLPREESVFAGVLIKPLVFDDMGKCLDYCLYAECNRYNYYGVLSEYIFIIDKDKNGIMYDFRSPFEFALISLKDVKDLSKLVDDEYGKYRYILAEQADDGKYYIYN